MLDLLSIFGFILAFLVGYQFPRKAGWGVLLIAPFLGPATFTFVPSSFLPLTTYRVAFAITLGVILRNHDRHGIPLSSIFKSTFVKIVLVFSLFVILISLEDRLKNIIFTYIPTLILAFALCYILIRDEKDLQRLVKIFVWQGFLISVFIILDFLTDFNVNLLLRKTIPEYDLMSLQSKQYSSAAQIVGLTRGGILRPMGIDGNAVQTGYRLAFLFPLALFYAISDKLLLKPWRSLPLLFVVIGLIMLYTRAAFAGVFVSLLALVIGIALLKKVRIIRKLRILVLLAMLLIVPSFLVVLINPSIGKSAYTVLEKSLYPFSRNELSIQPKLARIPVAIDYFMAKPFSGYGSPQYAYFGVMSCRDLPSPLIYLLAGGIFLCVIYLVMIFYMSYSVFRLSRKTWLNPAQKEFLAYACAAFVGGVVVVFSNWQEEHFMIMYMLYISIYKVYLYRGRPARI